MFRITLSLGGSVVRKYPFDKDTVTIGRDADCDISIDNVAVSRKHATIERSEGDYVLADLQSGNGTFVNGEKIMTHALLDGDSFLIGKYALTFENLDAVKGGLEASVGAAGGSTEDKTFRLDRKELEKLMGKAGVKPGEAGKGSLVPDGGGTPVPLTRPVHFAGSASDCTLPAAGFMVAPRLAAFLREEGGVRLVRVGGKFGSVTVNGSPVDSRVLREGEVVEICGKRYTFTAK